MFPPIINLYYVLSGNFILFTIVIYLWTMKFKIKLLLLVVLTCTMLHMLDKPFIYLFIYNH